MLLVAFFSACVALCSAKDAVLKANCDNYGILQISDDKGASFTDLVSYGSWQDWTKTLTQTIPDVTKKTVIRIICKDVGVVGGVIAQVEYDGEKYYTKDPLSDTSWSAKYESGAAVANPTYTASGSGAWGTVAPQNMESGAKWVWDQSTYNTIIFDFEFKDIAGGNGGGGKGGGGNGNGGNGNGPKPDATFIGNCDNYGTLKRSDDKGATWETLVAESGWNSWQVTLTNVFEKVSPATVLRVECRDVGVIGAFIGEVTVDGETYVTTSPITDGAWEVNTNDALTYKANGVSPWGAYASAVDSSAYWIWNGGETYNTLTFDFKFNKVLKSGPGSAARSKVNNPVDDVNDLYQPRYYEAPGKDAYPGLLDDAPTDAANGSLYYLMLLTCVLLFANIGLLTYSRCKQCHAGGAKYSQVDLYSDGEVAASSEIEA